MYLTKDGSDPLEIGKYGLAQIGWSPATQSQIDTYQLNGAKKTKIGDLKFALGEYRQTGYVYNTWTFSMIVGSAGHAKNKNDATLGGVNKYKYWDISVPRVNRDFTDAPGFAAFALAICEEEERLMEVYNNYQNQIEAATTVAEVDAITITFNA